MEDIKLYISYAAQIIEVIGVLTIVIGIIIALWHFVFIKGNEEKRYFSLKQELGKAILIGLEILVAGDIIKTVVTEPSLENVLTLGVIVLIRTFLSLSIVLEIQGKFPWQKRARE